MTLRATYRRLALLLALSVAVTLTVTDLAAATTWTHSVIGGYDIWYLNGTAQKFRYNLSNQQWSDFSTVGSSWYAISSTGRSNTFIGSGSWYDLGNGFSYQYSAGYDKGTFKDGAAQRFMYKYASGQWYDSADTLSWQVLGKAGLNAAFVGDGHWRDLGNGFTYQYSAGYDKGTFKDGAAQRFMYKYASGQWYDSADTLSWQPLGASGLAAGFLGDGRWRDLGNGFTYQYSAGDDKGTFKDGFVWRFLYKYVSGQWYDSGYTLSWQVLGKGGLNAAFVGDQHWHELGNGWDYQYSLGYHKGTFSDGYALFLFKYEKNWWWHCSQSNQEWTPLSAQGVSASFVGDGHWHDLGALGRITSWGWDYQYSPGYHKGTFHFQYDNTSFLYKYTNNWWWHFTTVWEPLSVQGVSASFVGDGNGHSLGNIDGLLWSYQFAVLPDPFWYDTVCAEGWFVADSGTVWEVWKTYNYSLHQWQ